MSARTKNKGKAVDQSNDWSEWAWDDPNYQWYRARIGADGKQHTGPSNPCRCPQATPNLRHLVFKSNTKRLQEKITSMNTVLLRRRHPEVRATQLEPLLLRGLLVVLIRHQHTTRVIGTAMQNLNQMMAMLPSFPKLLPG